MAELRQTLARLTALGGDPEEILQQVKQSLAIPSETKTDRRSERRNVETASEQEFTNFFFQHLKTKGIVIEEAGRTIVDGEALKKASLNSLGFSDVGGGVSAKLRRAYKPFLDAGLYQILQKTFQGKRVIDKRVWEEDRERSEKAEGVELLYRPASAAAALDPVAIRQAKFLVGPWEMKGLKGDWTDTSVFPDGTLTLEELTVAGMIYHPSCGDGKRDEKDRLLVKKTVDRDERRPISGTWFVDHGMYGGRTADGEVSLHAPARWIKSHPKLIRADVLKDTDFTSQSIHSTDQEMGVTHTRFVERVGTTGVGNVMFNGISHHVSRELKDRKDLIFANIDARLGLCTQRQEDGSLLPLFTFRVFQRTDSEIQARAQEGKFLTVGLRMIEKVPVSWQELEKGGVVSERLRLVQEYLAYKQSDKKLDRPADQRAQLSPGTLLAFHAWTEDLQQNTARFFQEFVASYGETAARFCLLFQETEKNELMQFFRRAAQLGRPVTRAIMERCLAMEVQGAVQAKELVHQSLEKSSSGQTTLEQSLKLELQRRWRRILEQVIKDKNPSFERLQVRLASLEKDNALFASMVRILCKGKDAQAAIDLMKGVSFDANILPKEIDARTRKEMSEIFDANWVDQDRTAARAFKKSLDTALDPTNEQTKFFLLKKDGETMAYIRFDNRPDLGSNVVYGGSLNVHPAFRQSGIGEVLMQKTIDRVAQEQVIQAHVVPDAVVGTAYVEQMKCVVTGVDMKKDPETGKETSILRLRRDDTRSYRARQPQLNWDALKAGTVPGTEVRQFDLATQKESFLTAIKQAASEGKVVTRYVADRAHPSIRWIVLERDVDPTLREPASIAP